MDTQGRDVTEASRYLTREEFGESRGLLARPIHTGAWVVVLRPDVGNATEVVNDVCSGFPGGYQVEPFDWEAEVGSEGGIAYDELGVAVIDHPEAGISASIADALMERDEVEQRLPEFYAFADSKAVFADTASDTWGRQATGADSSPFSGKGVRVAVLDTGIDVSHPDMAKKVIASRSFVAGEPVDDLHGHGTHCAGTVAASRKLPSTPEYGVAPDVKLMIGKVLSNGGSARQRDILRGMVWAAQHGAQVISMSLGRPNVLGAPYDPAYERAAAFALSKDSLVVAAAGNGSARRFGHIAPVESPADSPSAVAVAAVDQALDVAEFSNGSINGGGGVIDVAGPGVDIFSSWPLPRRHRSISGTSMACPHVAGVAALWVESHGLAAKKLRSRLGTTASGLGAASDFGKGLVQAPPAP